MKYAMCPKCGRRLCKGENGTKVEIPAKTANTVIFRITLRAATADIRT